MSDTIPGPKGMPFIGNLLDIRNGEYSIDAMRHMANQYGPIYQLTIMGNKRLIVSSYKLLNELCDEKRFSKVPPGPLGEAKDGKAVGLFSARNEDPNWGLAHRVLLPAFGPLAIENMFDDMHDIAKQLVLSWARKGPAHKIDAPADFTRLTLDTIALCAMEYRFNSFYHEGQHPFVEAMTTVLTEAGRQGSRLPVVSRFSGAAARVKASKEVQERIAGEIVEGRRKNPSDRKDLLNAMINGRDPKTGQSMPDDLITANMITFLIAGHETTSSLLSFSMYCLLTNAAAYREAQEEVDLVIGAGSISPHHLQELKYLNAVLRESIRLYPPAPAFVLRSNTAADSCFQLGEHIVEGKPPILVLLENVHRDPEVYGNDVEYFRPERMLDAKFDKLPKNAWKPFGNGMRACIGRTFAWQEALLAMAILLQRFSFRLDDPSYALHMKFSLTIKPKDLYIRATLRDGLDATSVERAMNAPPSDGSVKTKAQVPRNLQPPLDESGAQKITILYGSNTGTCETLAQKLVADCAMYGLKAEVSPLDSLTGPLPTDRSVVIITSSYEGQPPDNAIHFVEWLTSLREQELSGVRFSVFGCGHRDWHDTFFRIPKLVDEAMVLRGGTRIIPLGTCDVAEKGVVDQFDAWKDTLLWPALSPSANSKPVKGEVQPDIEMEISTDKRASALRQDVDLAVIRDTKILTSPDQPEKRHLEFQLPSEMSYRVGDYIGILPLNPAATVRRVLKRFCLPWDATIKIGSRNTTMLPTSAWISAHDMLQGYVELSQPASMKELRRMSTLAFDATEKTTLEEIVSSRLTNEAAMDNMSILDLLERFPSVNLSFSEFLTSLPPLRIRLYSISSSPLNDPTVCSITYSVLNTPGSSSWSSARHVGVASTYLSTLSPEDRVHFVLRPNKSGFHLPPTGLTAPVPIIMICAGTGLAPFRAFIQERVLQMSAQSGVNLAPALLFVGCRSSTGDRLYAEEFDAWNNQGAVDVRYAFSREVEESYDCKYVQDRIAKDRVEVKDLWDKGAKVYICGTSQLVRGVGGILRQILFEGEEEKRATDSWLEATKGERVLTDVFG